MKSTLQRFEENEDPVDDEEVRLNPNPNPNSRRPCLQSLFVFEILTLYLFYLYPNEHQSWNAK